MKKYLIFIIICFLVLILNTVKGETRSLNLIIIDPGHGGFDGGADSGTIYEKDIVLEISLLLRDYFMGIGYDVLMTRDEDYDLVSDPKHKKRTDIHRRVDIINNTDCLFYLSIHANAYPVQTLKGAQTFYNNNIAESKALSEAIQNSIKMILNNTHRMAKPIEGVYLIEKSVKIGSLVEVGFISNDEERNLLIDPKYQEKLAFSIYVGCLEFLQNY